jgi:adenosylmethionine-8-amino-7-oxononanoate aminotransferase
MLDVRLLRVNQKKINGKHMSEVLTNDKKHIWHPCAQMKDYESFLPLEVVSAHGVYLHLANGRQVLDAISSWWCKSLGHGHPSLQQAACEQIQQFEHVIMANTTHAVIANLSQRLAQLSPGLDKVFYAGDGSCAVEVALKMSLHARQIQGQTTRKKILALSGGYHGETLGALAVSDVGLYKAPYQAWLLVPELLSVPYVSGVDDPLWSDAGQAWRSAKVLLEPLADEITALIFEPIVQGAGGMRIYSADFLRRLVGWAKAKGIHIIADEIMTGLGRTGRWLACEHAKIDPDFICLSKSLTGGWLPFSAVLTHTPMYEIFYDDYASGKAFLHSHTYSGNALGARIAYEALQIIEQDNLCSRALQMQTLMRASMHQVAEQTGCLINVRGIGAMVAADLVAHPKESRAGYAVYQAAVERGALLRPLANTLYWLPPLTSSDEELMRLADITQQAICHVYKKR